jgi:hypothetical protein
MMNKKTVTMPSCGSWLKVMQDRIKFGPAIKSQLLEDKIENRLFYSA